MHAYELLVLGVIAACVLFDVLAACVPMNPHACIQEALNNTRKHARALQRERKNHILEKKHQHNLNLDLKMIDPRKHSFTLPFHLNIYFLLFLIDLLSNTLNNLACAAEN
jgi:hypothetical protein